MAENPTAANTATAPGPGAQKGGEIKASPRIMMQGGAYYMLMFHEREEDLTKIVGRATKQGYDVLRKGGTAVDAVEKAVRILEGNEYFNAGRGSLLNKDGEVECDALIMDGSTLNTGAVMAARHFKNPISISRKIMDESPHCAFSADGALAFAKEKGFDKYICEPQDLITDKAKSVKDKYKFGDFVEEVFPGNNPCEHDDYDDNHDTVSAVALDSNGHFACATSTGGIPGKSKGRISDAPLVGCGGYANEFGAATTSGHGESLMKMTLAREVVFNMEKLGQDAQLATKSAVQDMEKRIQGYGCAIAIDKNGNFGKAANSSVMIWAQMADDKMELGMERELKFKYDD